ncbi:hypothetical protein N9A25_00455 [bacterium]|nr:hypothetical protein [bacterium]
MYRITDLTLDEIVANGMSDIVIAYETLQLLEANEPTHTYHIESYTTSTVKPGFGRDPDLH